jgi:hypothetical protein
MILNETGFTRESCFTIEQKFDVAPFLMNSFIKRTSSRGLSWKLYSFSTTFTDQTRSVLNEVSLCEHPNLLRLSSCILWKIRYPDGHEFWYQSGDFPGNSSPWLQYPDLKQSKLDEDTKHRDLSSYLPIVLCEIVCSYSYQTPKIHILLFLHTWMKHLYIEHVEDRKGQRFRLYWLNEPIFASLPFSPRDTP